MATHERPEVRRAQILAAALHCFGSKGMHASKVDDIVQASGLSKGAIYWHFKSKDEIFMALFESIETELLEEWNALDSTDSLQTLSTIGHTTLERLLDMRPLLEAWTEFLRHPASRKRMGALYAVCREQIAENVRAGIERGQLRECDPMAVGGVMVALIEGLVLQAFADPSYDPLPVWPTAWETVTLGLLPRAPA